MISSDDYHRINTDKDYKLLLVNPKVVISWFNLLFFFMLRPSDPKNFFRKWVESLTSKENTTEEIDGYREHSVDTCMQTAVLSLLAVPILLNCNKPPPRKTTDVKLQQDINKTKDVFLNPSNDRIETKEILVKRAGSVKHTVAKYKMLQQKEEKTDNYYDFLRRSSLKGKAEKDQVDSPLKTSSSDFEPKEVIDVEKALLAQDEEEERHSRLSKVTTYVFNGIICSLFTILMFTGVFALMIHYVINS